MKKLYLGILVAIFALLVWACGSGSVDSVTDEELLMVGKWDPKPAEIQAMCDSCLADPLCRRDYERFSKKHNCIALDTADVDVESSDDDGGWGAESSSSKAMPKLSSSSAMEEESSDSEEPTSSEAGDEISSSGVAKRSSSSFSWGSSTAGGTSSASGEEEDIVVSSSSKKVSSSSVEEEESSSAGVVSSSATTSSSSARAARSSSSKMVIEMSSIAQSSSSAVSSSSKKQSSSSKAKSSSSVYVPVSTGSGATCADGDLQGECKVSGSSTVYVGEEVTWIWVPAETNKCSGDIVWYTQDNGPIGGDVHNGGTTLKVAYTVGEKKDETVFQMGGRRVGCEAATVVQVSATCPTVKAFPGQTKSLGNSVTELTSREIPYSMVVGSDTIGKVASCKSGSCSLSYTVPSSWSLGASKSYSLYFGSYKACSGTISVPSAYLTCSASSTTIDLGKSFTFTHNYGEGSGCNSASMTDNESSASTSCGTSQSIKPLTTGTHKYVYTANGTYGSQTCTQSVKVNALTPSCTVGNQKVIVGNEKFSISPSKVSGCEILKCDYAISNGSNNVAGGSGYETGSISDITAETTGGTVNYTLTLDNGVESSGSCGFSVEYVVVSDTTAASTASVAFAPGNHYVTTGSLGQNNRFKCTISGSMNIIVGKINGTELKLGGWSGAPSNTATLSNNSGYLFEVYEDLPGTLNCYLQNW